MIRGMVQSIAEKAQGSDSFLNKCLHDTLNTKLGFINATLLTHPGYSLAGLVIFFLAYLIVFFPLYLISLVFDSWLLAWILFFIFFYYLARMIARMISFPGSNSSSLQMTSSPYINFCLRHIETAAEIALDYSNFLLLVTSGRVSSNYLRQKDKDLEKLNSIYLTLPSMYTSLKDSFDYLSQSSSSTSPSTSSSVASFFKMALYHSSYFLSIPLKTFDISLEPGSYISPLEEQEGGISSESTTYSPLQSDNLLNSNTSNSDSTKTVRTIPYKPLVGLTPSENRDLFAFFEAFREFLSAIQQLFFHLQSPSDAQNPENKRNLLMMVSQEASVKSESLLRIIVEARKTLRVNLRDDGPHQSSSIFQTIVSGARSILSLTQQTSPYERLVFPMMKGAIIRMFGGRIIRIRPTEGYGSLEGVYISSSDAKEREYGANFTSFPIVSQCLPEKCSSRGIVLFFNPNAGFFENISQYDKNGSWLHYYLKENYDVFFFNYRSYSESWALRAIDPKLIKNDSLLFCDFLLKHYPTAKIIAHGESIGGMSACYVARMRSIPLTSDKESNRGGIETLICDRTFASLDATASRLMGEWSGIGVGVLSNWYTETVSDYLSTTCRKLVLQDHKDEIVKDCSSLRHGISYRILTNTFNSNVSEEALTEVEMFIRSSNLFGFLNNVNSHTKSNKFYLQALNLLGITNSIDQLEQGEISISESFGIQNKNFFNSLCTKSLLGLFTLGIFYPYNLLTLKDLPLWVVPVENNQSIYSRLIDSPMPFQNKLKETIYSIANPYSPISDEALSQFLACIYRVFQLSNKEYHYDDSKSNSTSSSTSKKNPDNLRHRKTHESGVLNALNKVEKIRKLGSFPGESGGDEVRDADLEDFENEESAVNLSDKTQTPNKHLPILSYQVITKIKMEDSFCDFPTEDSQTRSFPLLPWTKVKIVLLRTDGGFSRMLSHAAIKGLDSLRSWVFDYIVWNKEDANISSNSTPSYGINECEGCVFYGIDHTIKDLEKLLTLNESESLFSSISQFHNDEKNEDFEQTFVFLLSFLKALKVRRLLWLKSVENNKSLNPLPSSIPKIYHLFRPFSPSPSISTSSPTSIFSFCTSNISPYIISRDRLGDLITLTCGHNGWPKSHELSQITHWLFNK